MIKTIQTTPFDDQKPGTSGLRKLVTHFQKAHYLENFVQSIFNALPSLSGKALILGGDGRFHNDVAIQTILKMAAANGISEVMVGQNGILSTPAVSNLIRTTSAVGGIILSASHNAGGPDGDFGIKYNIENGGPAPEGLTEKIFELSKGMTEYKIVEADDVDISTLSTTTLAGMTVSVIDPVSAYVDMLEGLFDFDAVRTNFESGFKFTFDAMNAVTGPYAKQLFTDRLGVDPQHITRAEPLADFGGVHPDPNAVYAADLHALMFSAEASDLGAASDGDGDRNLVIGRNCTVSPSDSLAIIVANAHHVPAFANGVSGVGRSMPTSKAVDRVAKKLGIKVYETPTGWKYFGNLLDAGLINICGEESAGTGSYHVREKDGLWAVVCWLNILAARKISVQELVRLHWLEYGRNFYSRHDYEGVDMAKADQVMDGLVARLDALVGQTVLDETITRASEFSYHDPVDESISTNQGIVIEFESDARLIFRKSGTGTVGATLRVYFDKFEANPERFDDDPQTYLSDLIKIALQVSKLEDITGFSAPSLIS